MRKRHRNNIERASERYNVAKVCPMSAEEEERRSCRVHLRMMMMMMMMRMMLD